MGNEPRPIRARNREDPDPNTHLYTLDVAAAAAGLAAEPSRTEGRCVKVQQEIDTADCVTCESRSEEQSEGERRTRETTRVYSATTSEPKRGKAAADWIILRRIEGMGGGGHGSDTGIRLSRCRTD